MSILTMHRAADGALVVPIDDVVHSIGYGGSSPAIVHELAAKAGVKFKLRTLDDSERQFVSVEEAELLVERINGWKEQYYAKWDAYRAYLDEQKRKAQAERDRVAAEERKAARALALKRQQAWTEEMARKTEENIAERARVKALSDGNPLSPDQFFKRVG